MQRNATLVNFTEFLVHPGWREWIQNTFREFTNAFCKDVISEKQKLLKNFLRTILRNLMKSTFNVNHLILLQSLLSISQSNFIQTQIPFSDSQTIGFSLALSIIFHPSGTSSIWLHSAKWKIALSLADGFRWCGAADNWRRCCQARDASTVDGIKPTSSDFNQRWNVIWLKTFAFFLRYDIDGSSINQIELASRAWTLEKFSVTNVFWSIYCFIWFRGNCNQFYFKICRNQ